MTLPTTKPPHVQRYWGLELAALWALFVLTLRQQIRGKKVLVLVVLYLFFCGLAILMRSLGRPAPSPGLEYGFVFALVPQALAPLTALLFTSGMIQDEVEEQTLTYLLVRPLPRRALYLVKFLGTYLVAAFLTAAMSTLLLFATHWGDDSARGMLLERALKLALLLSLTTLTYCSVFAFVSLLFRRAVVLGVAYVLVLETFVASIDFVVRRLTVMYYFRVLCLRWLNPPEEVEQLWQRNWHIDLEQAPGLASCVETLLLASLIVTALSAVRFSLQEFHMKTPEST